MVVEEEEQEQQEQELQDAWPHEPLHNRYTCPPLQHPPLRPPSPPLSLPPPHSLHSVHWDFPFPLLIQTPFFPIDSPLLPPPP